MADIFLPDIQNDDVLAFQQEPKSIDDPRPWPVTVIHDGTVVHGRQDAYLLLGFQHGDEQRIKVWFSEVWEDPTKAIGMVPVFLGTDRNVFSVPLEVSTSQKAHVAVDQTFLRQIRGFANDPDARLAHSYSASAKQLAGLVHGEARTMAMQDRRDRK